MRRLQRSDSKMGAVGRWGLGGVMALIGVALLAPLLAPFPPEEQYDPVAGRYLPPLSSRTAIQLRSGAWLLAESVGPADGGLAIERQGQTEIIPAADLANPDLETASVQKFFLLGTDKYGRDLWSRIVFGARISLTIGLLATAIALVLGTVVGGLAAMAGGWIDILLMRLVDALLMFPRLFLILALAAIIGPRLWVVILVLGLTGWMSVSRLIRAEILSLRDVDYVLAARSLGLHPVLVFTRHMLPAALSPVLVDMSLRVGAVILIEAALSFLGQGVQPPTPSWGNVIADGADSLGSAWWVATFPGLAICLTVMAFNLLADGLRDRLDPHRFETR